MRKLKVAISFPPLFSEKGVPLLSQNRQFQWFSDPTYIYPIIPAYAATLLKINGYEVIWDDAIAENLTYQKWKERLIKNRPDIVAIETKTPVVKMHWKIINELKSESLRHGSWKPKFVLMGDHVTALPQESLNSSQVDFVIAGGDYDFILLSIAKELSGVGFFSQGVWYRNKNNCVVNSGTYDPLSNFLDLLPDIDRELTQWQLYSQKNGNFKYTPGSYIMNARDCWWGRCNFCSWTSFFPGEKYRVRSPWLAVREIEKLSQMGIKEIMEDSGTLPVGAWLEDFCWGLIEKKLSEKVFLGANMRFNAIKEQRIWNLMKKAGFRFVLFGLESANQETLDRLNKNLKVDEVEPTLRMAKMAGLEPHVTVMIGYPWETMSDTLKTLHFTKDLFEKGLIETLQATILMPYPGTPLFHYCDENNLLLTRDWGRYDQRELVMRCSFTNKEAKKLIRDFYKSFISLPYFMKKAKSIKRWSDIKYILKAGRKLLGHILDFS